MGDIEHKRRQEELEKRQKWAQFIAKNPAVFFAALKGISEARYIAELDAEIKKDFSPEDLTKEDFKRLEEIQNKHIPELEIQQDDKENPMAHLGYKITAEDIRGDEEHWNETAYKNIWNEEEKKDVKAPRKSETAGAPFDEFNLSYQDIKDTIEGKFTHKEIMDRKREEGSLHEEKEKRQEKVDAEKEKNPLWVSAYSPVKEKERAIEQTKEQEKTAENEKEKDEGR